MTKLSNVLVVRAHLAFAMVLAVGATARPAEGPAHALLLFGANWCAPCLDELRDLPALAAAVSPGQIVLVWRDGAPSRLWPSWPANALLVPSSEADRLVGGGDLSAGLPYAVLLDGKGRRCAIWNGKMTAERVGRIKARCAAASDGA